ncbi:MAG: hypothetical protein ACTSP1_12295 [Candidatus Freyarchaeota archaeon]
MSRFKIFYRYDIFADKQLLEENRQCYYGIVVGAHFAACFPDNTSQFLKTIGKPFFIDPVTYVFAMNPDAIQKKGNVKRSYKKLAKNYGRKIFEIAGKKPLNIKDFRSENKWNTELFREIAQKTLEFQKTVLTPKTRGSKSILRYLKALDREIEEKAKGPNFLVAPYFYIPSYEDPWYEISLRLARESKEFKENYPLFAVICISKEMLLNEAGFEKIKEDYAGFDGYILWVSNFNEEDLDEEYLEGMVKLVKKLTELRKPVYNLYGGYFSVMLSKFGLSGVSSGICYGSNKRVETPSASGAGLPKRYYVTLTHLKVPEADAREFFTEHPEKLCGCEVCSGIYRHKKNLSMNDVIYFFDRITRKQTREHFMHARKEELEKVESASLQEIIKSLEKEIEKVRSLNLEMYGFRYRQLEKWLKAMSHMRTLTKIP